MVYADILGYQPSSSNFASFSKAPAQGKVRRMDVTLVYTDGGSRLLIKYPLDGRGTVSRPVDVFFPFNVVSADFVRTETT